MKRFLLRLLASLACGAILLWLTSRQMSFRGTLAALGHVEWTVLIPFFGLMALQHVVRVWRWGELLAPIHRPSTGKLWAVSTVGFFAIMAFPLRMGEVVRPYLIAERPQLRVAHALGTVVVERVVDGLVLTSLAFLSIALASRTVVIPTWVSAAGGISLALFLGGLFVLILTLWQRDRTVQWVYAAFRLISVGLAKRVSNSVGAVVDGFRALPDRKRIITILAATIVYWLLNTFSFWVLAHGFGIDLGLLGSLSYLSFIGIGIMIPGGPGFVGNFEMFAQASLALFVPAAVLQQRGAAYILTSHVANGLWYTATGIIALLSPHASPARLWTITTTPEETLRREAAATR